MIFTSPPFPLNRKKKYGNKTGEEYLTWLHDLAPRLTELLTPDGSIVMELGNAWEPGSPVMSTLALEAFLAFKEAGKLNLCQQFVCHNPARLPSPAQWVNVERIRVKDSFTHIWWMSPTERPKADNRRVLTEYSDEMKDLLTRRSYNGGRTAVRPPDRPGILLQGQRRRDPAQRLRALEHHLDRQVPGVLPGTRHQGPPGAHAAGRGPVLRQDADGPR